MGSMDSFRSALSGTGADLGGEPDESTWVSPLLPGVGRTVRLTKLLAASGFDLESVRVKTPDGRSWDVVPVPEGRGRNRDGSWGPVPGARPGFRLFELDDCTHGDPEEHTCPDGDRWADGDLRDYLRAIGAAVAPLKVCSCPPCRDKASTGVRVRGWLVCATCGGRIG